MTSGVLPPAEPRIVLVTAPHCRLCRRARAVVEEVAARAGVAWRELDIVAEGASDPLWWEQIPVVLVDGKTVAYWHVEGADLEAALTAGA